MNVELIAANTDVRPQPVGACDCQSNDGSVTCQTSANCHRFVLLTPAPAAASDGVVAWLARVTRTTMSLVEPKISAQALHRDRFGDKVEPICQKDTSVFRKIADESWRDFYDLAAQMRSRWQERRILIALG